MTRTTSACAGLVATATALGVLTVSATSHAVERQHHAGVSLSFASLKVDDKSSLSLGGDLGAHYTYGLTDQFNLLAEGGYSQVSFGEASSAASMAVPKTRPTGVTHGAVGVAYVLDVLRWVPYGGVLAGADVLTGGTLAGPRVLPAVQLALGLDYQLDRSVTVGATFRQHLLFTDMTTYPSYTVVGAQLEYVWGW